MSKRICKPCKPFYKPPFWKPILAPQGSAEGISPHPLGNPTRRQRHHQREHPPSGRCPVTRRHQGQRPISRRSHCLPGNYWCLDCSRRHHDWNRPKDRELNRHTADRHRQIERHRYFSALQKQVQWQQQPPTSTSKQQRTRRVSWSEKQQLHRSANQRGIDD